MARQGRWKRNAMECSYLAKAPVKALLALGGYNPELPYSRRFWSERLSFQISKEVLEPILCFLFPFLPDQRIKVAKVRKGTGSLSAQCVMCCA